MSWPLAILVVVVVIVVLLALQRRSWVAPSAAREHLAQGALVVDVRSPGEFEREHLPNAVNIPLADLNTNLPKHVTDKNQVVLLHCLSGGRSEVARHRLKKLGYPNAYNLGSYARAKRIVSGG